MPGYIDFQNRAERRKALAEFRKEAEVKNIEGYKEYVAAMDELDKLMDSYYELDSFGLPKKFEAADKEKLLQSMKKTALAGETYLKNAQEKSKTDRSIKMNAGVPGMVSKLQGLLSQDYQNLGAYDTKAGKSLPELLEESRTVTIDVDKTKLSKLGGSMSSRMALDIDNGKKGKHSGVFTEASHQCFMKKYNKLVDDACKIIPNQEAKKAVKSFFPKFKKFICDADPKAKRLSDEYLGNKLVRNICGQKGNDGAGNGYDAKALKSLMKKVGVNMNAIDKRTIMALGNSLQMLNDGIDNVNIVHAGLEDGDRIDAANTGMSAVASLLGKPDMVAKSVNMNLRDKDGNIVNGTFMDYSSGLDLNRPDVSDFQALSDEPFKGTEGLLIKQLADMQVLDYICGNVDRHFGNLTYQVNEQGKVIGIQGIDNDCSFGRIFDLNERHKEMPGLNNMNCISKSMADKIMGLDESMLKFSLRGRGLKDDQIEYAAERLKDLKAAIKKGEKHYEGRGDASKEKNPFDKGYLRTVPDAEMEKLTMQQAYKHGKTEKTTQYNLFCEVDQWLNGRLALARDKGYTYDPDYMKKGLQTGSGRTSDRRYTVGELARPIMGSDALVKREEFDVDKLTDGNRGTQAFADIVEASKALHNLNKEFAELQRNGKQMTAVDYKHYYNKLSEAVKRVDDTSETYLNGKIQQRKAHSLRDLRGKNQYEQKRIDYAKQSSAFAKDALEQIKKLVKPAEEMSEQDKIDYRTIREREGLEERRKALEALKKLHAELGMEDPEKMKADREAERKKLHKEEKQEEAKKEQQGIVLQ